MRCRLYCTYLLLYVSYTAAKEPELPLCPTNIQYFPQNLPMHCRMPTGADVQNNQIPSLPPFPPSFYQTPPPGVDAEPIPIPVPPGIPGMPPGMIAPMPIPGGMPMPGGMPIPMPMPGQPGPAHKLPVIVMPFYSPDNSFKKPQPSPRRPHPRKKFRFRKRPKSQYFSDTDPSSETDTSSNDITDTSESDGWWNGRRNRKPRSNKRHREKRRRHQRQELLTPVLQYVTKDGYVIFEKKISKGEAKDWLKVKNDEIEVTKPPKQEIDEFEDEPVEVKPDKEKEKVEVKTERNSQKHHKKKKFRLTKKVEE
ncbi:unnamed protein product [Pieris brassicae]|uniref:Uncharacterized protein n=1 Tax=Pieris brassicae TaxID=7116 RepID=A0A9P0SYN5_PIEBR|nr:unnamed protein product [Pieris brassicae]